MDGRLRVAINAQLMPGTGTGGIETVLRALTALARLEGGAEEYVFVGPHDDPEWLRDLLPAGQRIVRGPAPAPPGGLKVDRLEPFKRALGPLRPAARNVRRFISTAATGDMLALPNTRPGASTVGAEAQRGSKNFYQRLGCDVVHFPFQYFEACGLPSVYNPHDLQHLHHPEFFAAEEVMRRDALHLAACRAAHTVVVASEFVKQDVVRGYGVGPSKVQIVPWAPPPLTVAARACDESSIKTVREKFQLGDGPFALYPAMTWEHKNHLRLLESLAILRDRTGLDVRVVCTGFKTDFWPRVERRLLELGLESRVKFPGLVSQEDLGALYRAAQFVLIPTLFEAASAPMFEAWQHGAAVACSSVTSLPEQAGGAALLFDPTSAESIADALARMTTDAALREELRRRGARRLADFSIERTARGYRAVYRRAAGRPLDAEDLGLLGWDWMRESRGEVEAHGE